MDSSSSQPQSLQSSSPSPSPNTTGMTPLAAPIIPPLYVDNLAKEFGLGEPDLRKLRGLVQVVTVTGGTITQSDLASRLYMTAIILSEAAERRRQEQQNAFPDLRAMMRDLKIRLDDGFALTSDQKRNIRGIAQDTIHEATRTAFFTMHVDVLSTLKATAQKLDLDNIFGVPVREKKLVSTLKKTCSSVRNAFRQDIRDSIEPGDFVTLDKFTYAMASKYKLGGGVGELSELFTVHAALLGIWLIFSSHKVISVIKWCFCQWCWIRVTPILLGIDEVVDKADDDTSEGATPSPAKRKRTAAKKGGRIPKGQDFWSKTDAYLKEEVGKRGRNFTDPRWKVYIDQIIADDKSKFRGMTPGVPVSALMVHDPANGNGNAGAGVVANTSTGMTPAPFTFGSGEFGAFATMGKSGDDQEETQMMQAQATVVAAASLLSQLSWRPFLKTFSAGLDQQRIKSIAPKKWDDALEKFRKLMKKCSSKVFDSNRGWDKHESSWMCLWAVVSMDDTAMLWLSSSLLPSFFPSSHAAASAFSDVLGTGGWPAIL
ncbi:hypothetical protein DFH09DRAFT_1503147 [Mycena vulgaris]|nr:hypothetical protein DFH09DRAFT_1503147 [Mycena vulgaris]